MAILESVLAFSISFLAILVVIQFQFLPILQSIKIKLKIPNSLAGITLIAFGNGAGGMNKSQIMEIA